jgi:hypothetical protein
MLLAWIVSLPGAGIFAIAMSYLGAMLYQSIEKSRFSGRDGKTNAVNVSILAMIEHTLVNLLG